MGDTDAFTDADTIPLIEEPIMSPWHRRQDYNDSLILLTPIAAICAVMLLWFFI